MTTRRPPLAASMAGLALLAVTAMLFLEVARWIRLPVFLDNTEIYLAFGIRSFATEGVLYRDLSHLPLVVTTYQPLSYLPAALLLQLPWMSGVELLPAARLLNLPILLATLVVLYRIARRLAGAGDVAAMAVVVVAYSNSVFLPEIIRIRPENGAMLFTLAALLLALRRRPRWWMWAAIAIAIANFFKPTFLALPLAIALHELLEGRRASAIRFTALTGAAFMGFVGLATFAFGTTYLTQTLRFSAANPDLPLWQVPVLVLGWIRLFGPPFVPLAAGAASLLRQAGVRSLLPVYLLTCTGLTLVGLTKTGADIHYLIELSFVVLFGCLAALPKRRALSLLTIVAALAIGSQAFRTGATTVKFCAHRHAGDLACDYSSPLPPTTTAARRSARDARAVVFDEALAFESGKVVALDWTLLDLLVRSHAIDPAPLFARLDAPTTTRAVFPRRANPLLESLYQAALDAGFTPAADSEGSVLERPRVATAPHRLLRREPVSLITPIPTGSLPRSRSARAIASGNMNAFSPFYRRGILPADKVPRTHQDGHLSAVKHPGSANGKLNPTAPDG